MTRFDDGVLDQARREGDPEADALIAGLLERGQGTSIGELMVALSGQAADLPAELLEYLHGPAGLPQLDPRRLERGHAVFVEHAPEILMVLAFYSLPSAYAARCGVQVLSRTGYLCRRPVQRLCGTALSVIRMLRPGSLQPGGAGVLAARQIRLIHALVRRRLRFDPRRPWPEAWGTPINQEDLAGTLMTFSFLVLDGLDKLDVALPAEQREDYLYIWVVLGQLLGVRVDLLPTDVRQAEELTRRIYARQIVESAEGKRLTRALLEGLQGLAPVPGLGGFPAAMIRHFLQRDPFGGLDVARLLGVPEADWTEHLVRGVVWATGAASAAGRRSVAWRRVRRARLGLIEGVFRAQGRVRHLRSSVARGWGGRPRPQAEAR